MLYQKNQEPATYRHVNPYQLINHKGIWYLAAQEQGKLKTFSLAKIRTLHIKSEKFEPEPKIEQELLSSDGIFFGTGAQKIVLKVDQEVAHYFKRRKVLPNQQIEEELQEGGLIVSGFSANEFHLLAIVRYWIPFVRIMSPQASILKNNQILKNYLE